jgi:outer membrane protein assembly factor BamB
MASEDGVVYAPIVNIPTVFNTQTKFDLQIPKGTGEMVALNVSDGSMKWKRDLAQPAYGAATISNDLVFTTTFDGKLRAYSTEDGSEVWSSDLGAGTNSPLAIAGDTLVTAAGFPQGAGQKAQLVVYTLKAED